nr:glycosyl hydrolase [Micromonospora cremea]
MGHPGVTSPKGSEFVPMIWGAKSVTASNLQQAKKNGRQLLGFNEPDMGGQPVPAGRVPHRGDPDAGWAVLAAAVRLVRPARHRQGPDRALPYRQRRDRRGPGLPGRTPTGTTAGPRGPATSGGARSPAPGVPCRC